MSKTRQRKEQAYKDGYADALSGNSVRWRRHPFLTHYKRGFRAGSDQRKAVTQTPPVEGFDDI